MKRRKPKGSVHPVNKKSMLSKQLTIHTVIKICNFCPKWSTHQEYVARMFFHSFFWQQSPSMYSFWTASSFKWCLQTLSTLGVKYLARKDKIWLGFMHYNPRLYRAIGSTNDFGTFLFSTTWQFYIVWHHHWKKTSNK